MGRQSSAMVYNNHHGSRNTYSPLKLPHSEIQVISSFILGVTVPGSNLELEVLQRLTWGMYQYMK